jgi:flagellar biosynthesis anti-sigma factor FlgM
MQISEHDPTGLPHMSSNGVGGARNIARSTPTAGRQSTNASTSASDSVALSSKARDIQRTKQILLQLPPIRLHRVAEAARVLQQGRLNLNGSDLADRLLSDPLHAMGLNA